MTTIAEYNQRQYQLMAKFLDEIDYSDVKGLGQLVDSLSALVGVLEEPDEVWEADFISAWATLEEIYADARVSYEDAPDDFTNELSVEDINLAEEAVRQLKEMVKAVSSIEITKAAEKKLETIAKKFGTTTDDMLSEVLASDSIFRDTDTGNLNIWISRPDNSSGLIRVILNPSGKRVISGGLNHGKDVGNVLKKERFIYIS